jgi:hypothetical protein
MPFVFGQVLLCDFMTLNSFKLSLVHGQYSYPLLYFRKLFGEGKYSNLPQIILGRARV